MTVRPLGVVRAVTHSPFTNRLVTSLDTMKVSRDATLTTGQIAAAVAACVALNSTHIGVATDMGNPSYAQLWVNAIRAAGRKCWFRPGISWGIVGPSPTFTPEYNRIKAWVTANPGLWAPGDVIDAHPEPELDTFWFNTYGGSWSSPGSAGAIAYNAYLVASTQAARDGLTTLGISGCITGIRSTTGQVANVQPSGQPTITQATANTLGYVTIDTYPEGSNVSDPTQAAYWRWANLKNVIDTYTTVPVVYGEWGYNNTTDVSGLPALQETMIHAEVNRFLTDPDILPRLGGLNYWVGPGALGAGGYTWVIDGAYTGPFVARPAAAAIAKLFAIAQQ